MGWFIRLLARDVYGASKEGVKKYGKPTAKLGIDGKVVYNRRSR